MLGCDLIDREEIVSEVEVAAKVMWRLGAGGLGWKPGIGAYSYYLAKYPMHGSG